MSITGIYTCPECKQPVTTRCTATNVIVCSHCYAPIERQLDGYLNQRANLLITRDDSSPIQIGTRGAWDKRQFEIIGRMRCVFVEGYTNNWTMLFDGGDIGMLVESFGQFAVYEKTVLENDVSFSQLMRMEYGAETRELFNNKQYTLERQQYCQYIEVEGETWVFNEGEPFTSLEMAAQGGGRLALINSKKREEYTSFRIHYQPMSDFKLENLRSQQIGIVAKEITCTNCNTTIPLYSWPLAQSCTCITCGASYVFEKGVPKYKLRVKLEKKPAIPLYARGIIRGTEYQVVGFMEKEDEEGYKWREYTLYNPVQGYTFLSEYNGHWIFLREITDAPVIVSNKTMAYSYDGKTFKLFNQYRFSLVDCQGEFPGDVFDNQKPNCKEFVAPPEIWARELYEWGICWFHGEHIAASELKNAFTSCTLPYKTGVGSVAPTWGQVDPDVMKRSILGAALFFLLLFLLTTVFNREQVIYDNNISFMDTLSPIVTPVFKLDKWRSNVEFDVSAPVSNTWFEAGITLVNKDNGNEYSIEKGVEQYSGYEDGESWSEGSDHDEVILHSIPAGNYFMQILPARGDASVQNFSLKVIYDVPMWHNFFMFILLALLPIVVLFINIIVKEGIRWQNSPFYHN